MDGRIGPYIVESPMVLGHESSGTIDKVGSSVKSLKPGDRVALEPGVPCRRCPACKSGHYNLCADMAFASSPPVDGTLCKYYSLPEDYCYKLPEHVSLEEGALVEPTSVAVHTVRQADVRPGDTLVVFGAGPVGLLCGAVGGAFGAEKVVMVDIQPKRLAFAEQWCGKGGMKTTTFMPGKDESAEQNAARLIKESDLGIGADVVIDASGAEASVATGLAVLRRGGTYVQGGMGKPDINFPILTLCTKEITMKGSFRYGEGDYRVAVELVSSGKVDAKGLITGKVSFEEAEKAFGTVRKGEGIKTLIEGVKD